MEEDKDSSEEVGLVEEETESLEEGEKFLTFPSIAPYFQPFLFLS